MPETVRLPRSRCRREHRVEYQFQNAELKLSRLRLPRDFRCFVQTNRWEEKCATADGHHALVDKRDLDEIVLLLA